MIEVELAVKVVCHEGRFFVHIPTTINDHGPITEEQREFAITKARLYVDSLSDEQLTHHCKHPIVKFGLGHVGVIECP